MTDEPANALPLPVRPPMEVRPDGAIRMWAPAKINLNLLVGPRGADGFHPLDSLVAKVTLYDRIDLSPRDDGALALTCEPAGCGPDERNLALRAARLLAEGRRVPGAVIRLAKRIPPGRGLGGGSSDAAAVLLGLGRLWNLRVSPARLARLAAELGSDVPLFLGPPALRMTGRGEKVEPVAVHDFCAVLFLPDFSCGTHEVYRAFDECPSSPGAQLDAALLAGPPSRWRHRLVNQLAAAAETVRGELREMRAAISRVVSLPVCLTSSGSAMFVLCDDCDEAAAVAAAAAGAVRVRSVVVAPSG